LGNRRYIQFNLKGLKHILTLASFLLFINGFSQNEWPKVYHDGQDAPKLFFLESYDHGYLLMGRNRWSYPKFNWLIKTDINGYVLWEKTLGNGNDGINIYGLSLNNANELYLVGRNSLVGDYPDPMIMKLNKCGEKEWCKIFSSPGYQDLFRGICTTKDGGCATIMLGESLGDKDYLCRFSNEGELLWKYYYPPTTGQTGLERTTHLILTPDQGFLMTGFCYYSNPWDTLSYLSPYYIKADSVGNFAWAFDSLASMFLYETYPGPRYELAFLYLDCEYSIGMQSTLNNIPVEFDLSEREITIHDLFIEYFNILFEMQMDSIMTMDSIHQLALMDIADNSHLLPGIYARNLLINHGLLEYEETIYLPESLKDAPVSASSELPARENPKFIKVYPNPAGSYLIIEYDLRSTISEAVILISDINGRILDTFVLEDKQNQRLIDTDPFSPGLHILQLYSPSLSTGFCMLY
jgi:hypothetical protein